MYKIENDIPLPTYTGRGGPRILPFYDMSVGQSVYLEGKTRASFAGVLGRLKNKKGWEFCTRADEGGTRVWRIK